MRVAFYAIDESDSPDTRIVSMIGVLVPIRNYQDVAGTFYRFINELMPGTAIHLNPPELHGSSLLKDYDWATDEHKLACFRMVVDLVNRLKLKVKRAAYLKHSVSTFLATDPKLHGLNFVNMQWMIQAELKTTIVIPVFDGLDEQVGAKLSAQGQSLASLLALGLRNSLSVQPPENMCEPLFTSSKHSALMQLADLISYLLHTLDYEYCKLKVTNFKMKLQEIARSLDESLVDNQIIVMETHSGEQ